MDKFITVSTGSNDSTNRDAKIVKYIREQLSWFSSARGKREDTWLDCWAMYLGSPEATDDIRRRMIHTVGDTTTDWRHKLNLGKSYETVETIVTYLMGAFFPNNDWFDAAPVKPGYADLVIPIKKATQEIMYEGEFLSQFESFIRQTVITGFSCIAVPWRYETKKWKSKVRVSRPVYEEYGSDIGEKNKYKEVTELRVIANHPAYETLDIFDVYLQPNVSNINQSPVIRRITKTKAEVAHCIQSGYFKNMTMSDLEGIKPLSHFDYTGNRDRVQEYLGMQSGNEGSNKEIEVYEYWGDLHLSGKTYFDVVATIVGNSLVRFETNPYWCGCPFVFGSYTAVPRSGISMGALEPSMGVMHEHNSIANHRLDCLEISIDPMFEKLDDGRIMDEDVSSRPGKVYKVSEMGSIRPIEMRSDYTITYQESSVLEQRIDKVTGTGFMVGAGAGRNAERVTAEEVISTKEAGGARLSGVYQHIKRTALMPILDKTYRLIQQFQEEPKIVRIPSNDALESYDFVEVGVEEFQHEFKFYPVGSDHVIDKQEEINKYNQIFALLQYPGMPEKINMDNLLFAFLRALGLDNIELLINNTEQEAPMGEEQPDPAMMQQQAGGIDQLLQEAYKMGGTPAQTSVNTALQTDGGEELISRILGKGGQPMSSPPPELGTLAQTL